MPAGRNIDAPQAAPAHSLAALTAGEMGCGGLALLTLLWLRWLQMGASFLWPRTPDPMRRIGVGIFFGMCGTFFQSLTEWVFHQTPIFFTFNIMLGVLASLYAIKKAEKRARKERLATERELERRIRLITARTFGILLICARFICSENIIPPQWGGTETAIQRLFDGLREHNVESIVYCPKLRRKPEKDPLAAGGYRIERFRAFVPIIGISAQRKRQIVSVGGNLMSLDMIPRLWREKDISIVHTHTLGRIGGMGRFVARRRGVPLVVTIHGGVLDLPAQIKKEFNAPVGGWEWGKVFGLVLQSRRLFPDADAIITCNESEARLLREKYPGKRVVVQPHGVPLAMYEQDQRDHALEAFPQIRGKQLLLCVGRIDPIKNQSWLVEQAPAIFQKHPRAVLVFAGACTDEEYGERLRRRIEELGLQERVLLTGGLPPNDPRLIGLFQEAEVLLLPSKSETFGLVVLEAWATGTMVLSTRTSGACTLVRHGQNGWLFDLDKPESFHEPLSQALAKSDTARRVLRRGGDEVQTQYNIGALAGRMKALYEELIEEKNAIRDSARRRHECANAH